MAIPNVQIGEDLLGTALLSRVEVLQQVNRHWYCTVVCRGTLDDRIPVEDLVGKPVTVATTDDEGVRQEHFTGSITDVSLLYEEWGSYTATLKAVSDTSRMDIARRLQYYSAGTLHSVATKLAGHSGLSATVNAVDTKPLNYVQHGETDFAFLHRITDDAGAWFRPVSSGVEVFDQFQGGATVQWRAQPGLVEFNLKATVVAPGVNGAHYDFHAMQSSTPQRITKTPEVFPTAGWLTGAAQTASQKLPPAFESQRGRAMTLADYQAQLSAESERIHGSAVAGKGVSDLQSLKAGDTLTVEGDLNAAGVHGLTRVEHRWSARGYTNHFECTPWKHYRDPQPPPMHTWEGVVSARVVDHNDPKKMGRLRVQFFWQEDGFAHWARLLSAHAGSDRGLMFLPEVGDEVAVMFEDGDMERPLIVGSVWNGVHTAPRAGFFAPDADVPDNNVKRMVTKSGNRMQMVDTPDRETIVLATPHSTKFLMTEKSDATSRSLVSLQSAGDILLSAPNGRIHLQSAFFSRQVGDGTEGVSSNVLSQCAAEAAQDDQLVSAVAARAAAVLARPGDTTRCKVRAGGMAVRGPRLAHYSKALPAARAVLDVNQLGDKPGSASLPGPCVTRLPDTGAALCAALGLPPGTITDSMLRDDKSGYRAAMYMNEQTGRPMLVARDTQPHSLVDWETNTTNGDHKDTKQYMQNRTLNQVLTRNNVAYDNAGYSKAGGLALDGSLVNRTGTTTVFNSAGIPQTIMYPDGSVEDRTAAIQEAGKRATSYSAPDDFLTFLSTEEDPDKQLANAKWLRDQLASSGKYPWQPIGIKYRNPEQLGKVDDAFAADKEAYLQNLDASIAKSEAARAAGNPIQVFPPVNAATHETIAEGPGWIPTIAQSSSPNPNIGKLWQHQMTVVAAGMETTVKKDREAMTRFLAECQ